VRPIFGNVKFEIVTGKTVGRIETATVRIEPKTKAALDLLITERYVKTGKGMTLSEAIWYLFQLSRSDILEKIEEMANEPEEDKGD
jgi:hypothetical protein